MIPRVELEPIGPIDLGAVAGACRDWIEYPNWLGIQRDYNPELHAEATWDRVSELIDEERDILARVDTASRDWTEFDEAAYEQYEAEGSLYGLLELGVTSLVYALNAAGCVTASSCRGHPGQGSGRPWVLFAASPERVQRIARLAFRAGVAIDNMDGGGVALLAPSVAETLALADRMLLEARFFDGLPTLEG